MRKIEIRGNVFLYRRIQAHLERLVRQGALKADDKIPGERVLSQQLDVSRDTVRAALRELEEQGFLERVPAKGTFIRRENPGRELKVAFVFPEPEISLIYQSYGNYATNSEIWRGMVARGTELGGTVSFCTARPHLSGPKARELAAELSRNYSGVIFPSAEFDQTAAHLIAEGFPCVFTGDHDRFCHVAYDRELAVRLAAEHLLDNGCRSVMLLGRPGGSYEQKIAGFRRAFAARGVKLPDADIISLDSDREALFHDLEKVVSARRGRPDAIFCATPIISFAVLHLAAAGQWKIPEETMVLGYANNMDQQRTIPLLTHIRLPHAAMGATAVELISARVRDGAAMPRETLLQPELIQGETTLPVSGGRAAMSN